MLGTVHRECVKRKLCCHDGADMEGPTVLERVAACLPCASWPCAGSGRHWQLWPSESFDDDARPILTAPTPALAECLIPPSVSNLYDGRDQTSPEYSAPSWDIGAGRPPAHQVSTGAGELCGLW